MYKFLVETEKQSIKLQKILFKCGYKFDDHILAMHLDIPRKISIPCFLIINTENNTFKTQDYWMHELLDYKLLTIHFFDCFDEDGNFIGKFGSIPGVILGAIGNLQLNLAEILKTYNQQKTLKPVNEHCLFKECFFWNTEKKEDDINSIRTIFVGRNSCYTSIDTIDERYFALHIKNTDRYSDLPNFSKLFVYGYCGCVAYSHVERCKDVIYGDEDKL